MAFLNKQEDVIDIKLTSYGKKVLSKGKFRPAFYAFYDDGINYQTPEEEQNNTQDRIKQDLTMRTIAEVAGAETRFEIQNKKILEGQRSLYEEMEETPDPASIGKLLQYELASQNLQSQKAPRFELKLQSSARIDTDLSSETLILSGVLYNTPQLNITSTYKLNVDKSDQKKLLPENFIVRDEDPLPDLMASEIEFLDKTKLKVLNDKIIIELKEHNVGYSSENFEVEIYEIIDQNSSEQLIQIETIEELSDIFVVKTDESVDRYLSLKSAQQSGLFGYREREE